MKHRLAAAVAAGLAIAMLGIPSAASASDYVEQLPTNAWLGGGDSLWSPNRLTQQTDGNLVLYAMPGNKPLWAAGTMGARFAATQMQSDGNLVVRAQGNVPVWASRSSGKYPVLLCRMMRMSSFVPKEIYRCGPRAHKP